MSHDLFDPEPYRAPPEPELGADARRTQRNLAALAAGRHPVGRRPLHPDAPPVGDRAAAGPRCGGCAHLFRKVRAGTYLKCEQNATGGPGTDLRAWWPACADYQPNAKENQQ